MELFFLIFLGGIGILEFTMLIGILFIEPLRESRELNSCLDIEKIKDCIR